MHKKGMSCKKHGKGLSGGWSGVEVGLEGKLSIRLFSKYPRILAKKIE